MTSLKNLKFTQDATVTRINQTRSFFITFDSLGLPSCMMLSYSTGVNTSTPVTYGDQTFCTSIYPNLTYDGSYQIAYSSRINSSFLTISQRIMYEATFTMNAVFTNQIGSISISTPFTVSSSSCRLPTLSIQGSSTDFFNPVVYKRSQMFTLISSTTLNCNTSLSNTKQWLVNSVNPNTGAIVNAVNITGWPSSTSAQLVVQKNSFAYNLYQFVYQVTMDASDSSASSFTASTYTYVRIAPAGVVVFAFAQGLQAITRGTQQSVELNPGLYSYDIDGIESAMSLAYKYYCRTIDSGSYNAYPTSQLYSYNVNMDLATMQVTNDSTMYTNKSCFSSSSEYRMPTID
jgi:hypothetical protein